MFEVVFHNSVSKQLWELSDYSFRTYKYKLILAIKLLLSSRGFLEPVSTPQEMYNYVGSVTGVLPWVIERIYRNRERYVNKLIWLS